jgi:catechol 2,3-dioxygenase-like lactoylglutathione lyase family enzyme
MKLRQIKETCIYVNDLEQTQIFYQRVLDLPLIGKKPGRHVFFRAGTSVLLCFIPEASSRESELPPHFAKGPAHLAFEVGLTEYEDWKQKVKLAGIEIIHEQSWAERFLSFYFHDPDGHLLEIVQEGMWE